METPQHYQLHEHLGKLLEDACEDLKGIRKSLVLIECFLVALSEHIGFKPADPERLLAEVLQKISKKY